MRRLLPATAVVAGMFALAGCGSPGDASEENEAAAPNAAEQVDEESTVKSSVEGTPCFSVPDVGTELSMTWELVVAARDSLDQQDYIDDLQDAGDDLFDDIEDDTRCDGGVELADFNYEVAKLNIDVTLGEDADQQYENIADIGNTLLDLSDDQGYEWAYEFVTDVN